MVVKLDARKSGSFKIGGDIEVHRLGFGAMRITGPGIWGPPADGRSIEASAWIGSTARSNEIDQDTKQGEA
jgi:hypothetical protein